MTLAARSARDRQVSAGSVHAGGYVTHPTSVLVSIWAFVAAAAFAGIDSWLWLLAGLLGGVSLSGST